MEVKHTQTQTQELVYRVYTLHQGMSYFLKDRILASETNQALYHLSSCHNNQSMDLTFEISGTLILIEFYSLIIF